MGFPTVDRYADLIKAIIPGSFYESRGIAIPYRSGLTTLRLETSQVSTQFGIYINEIFAGVETSDANGNLVFKRLLPKGEIELTIISRADGRSSTSYVTVRDYALWLAAYGDALEEIDDNIIQVRDNAAIETAELDSLHYAFGEAVDLFADIGQGVDAYRWQVHELRQAYRDTGARFRGLEDAVSVITQVPPFGYSRRKWGPNWRLDQTMLVNHRFLNRSHTLTNTTGTVTGVELVEAEPDVVSNPGAPHQLQWDAGARTLTWVPGGLTGPAVPVREGSLFLPGPSEQGSYILAKTGYTGPFAINAGINDRLYFHIEGLPTLTVPITPAPTVAQVVIDINAASAADVAYPAVTAVAYNSRVLIFSNTASYIVLEHGTHNAATEIFGIRPGDLHMPQGEGTVMDGVDLVQVLGTMAFLGDGEIQHYYDETLTIPHRLRWKSPTGAYAGYINIPASGKYTLIDSVANSLEVQVWVGTGDHYLNVQTGAPLTETLSFALTFNRKDEVIYQRQGLWVDVTIDDLDPVNQADTITLYDDVTDSRPETPDYWFLDPLNPGTCTTSFYPSQVIRSKVDYFDPSPAFQYRVVDAAITAIDVIGHAERFPLIYQTPRGSNFPQKGPGMFYDYEGFEAVFSGWFKTPLAAATTVRLDLSFDGGDNWILGSATAITNDPGGNDLEEMTFVSTSTTIPADILYRETVPLTWEDSGVLVRVHYSQPGGQVNLQMDGVNLAVKYISSQALGNATVPRSRHRQYFGELLWVWAPEALSLRENQYLGLPHKTISRTAPFGGVYIDTVSSTTPNGTGVMTYEYNSTGHTKRLKWEPSGTAFAPGFGWTTLLSDGPYILTATDGSTVTVNVTYSELPTLTGTMPVERTRSLVVTDQTVSQGHPRMISAAHSDLDIFDATEYDPVSGDPLNLFGAMIESDFSIAGLVNCEIQKAEPFKYSYIYPEFESQEGETLALSLVGPNWVATLDYHSDEDQEEAILYEDGIPVPNDWWSFSASNQVSIPNAWFVGGQLDTTATFTLDYDLIYQVETSLIDLPPTFQDYMWLADYYLWQRYDKEEGEYYAETPVYFNVENGQASLPYRSNMERTTSRLYVQQSTEAREIPQRYWRFASDEIVQIDLAYLVDGQYYLQHYEKRCYENSNLTVTFEHKSGDSPANCTAATYATVERNSNVDVHQDRDGVTTPHDFHQLRISISGVRDLRDFRLRSMVLKGLKIHGLSPDVDGLTDIWGS